MRYIPYLVNRIVISITAHSLQIFCKLGKKELCIRKYLHHYVATAIQIDGMWLRVLWISYYDVGSVCANMLKINHPQLADCSLATHFRYVHVIHSFYKCRLFLSSKLSFICLSLPTSYWCRNMLMTVKQIQLKEFSPAHVVWCDRVGRIPITTYYVCTLILFAKDGDRDKYKDKYNLFSLVISCRMEEASKCYYDYLLMICSSPQQKQIHI